MPRAHRLAATWRRKRPGADLLPPAGAAAAGAAPVSCDTGFSCLFRLGIEAGTYADIDAVKRRHSIDGPTIASARLAAVAGDFGLAAAPVRLDWHALVTRAFAHPLILVLANMNAVVLKGVRRGGAPEAPGELAVSDPLFRDGEIFFLGRDDLERAWSGAALVVTPLPPSRDDGRFGFSWLTTKLFAERGLIRDVVLAALAMHLIALSVPIFFQILVDRVIPNQAFATLYTITAGIFVLILFDAGFNYMRNYLLAFITRKLDHVVATETIEHLLKLPIDFFHANPSGVTAYKLQEANNVREFLASRLFNTFLDFMSVVIFLPVLLIYSWQLTLIVLLVSGIAFLALAVMSREFRLKLRDVNDIEGRRKAFLYELLNGIETIKTLASNRARSCVGAAAPTRRRPRPCRSTIPRPAREAW